jgi:hypothetical protein
MGAARWRSNPAYQVFPVCAQILFCSGVWSYLVASIATPTFILVRSTRL